MSNLPNWAQFSIVAAAVLLCPVFAFLMAIAVEILIGVLKDAGVPALLVLIVAGGAWSLFRKLRVRPHRGTAVET
jgi:hypothetical protein